MKACEKKFEIDQLQLPVQQRRPLPKGPSAADIVAARTAASAAENRPLRGMAGGSNWIDELNAQSVTAFEANMCPCQHCGRTFSGPDRLAIHYKSCKPGKTSVPVGGRRPISEEEATDASSYAAAAAAAVAALATITTAPPRPTGTRSTPASAFTQPQPQLQRTSLAPPRSQSTATMPQAVSTRPPPPPARASVAAASPVLRRAPANGDVDVIVWPAARPAPAPAATLPPMVSRGDGDDGAETGVVWARRPAPMAKAQRAEFNF